MTTGMTSVRGNFVKAVPSVTAEAVGDATSPEPVTGFIVKAPAANAAGSYVYIGGPSVTTADGLPLEPGESIFLPVHRCAGLYCLGSEADLELRILVL